jgi:hypothetical protein
MSLVHQTVPSKGRSLHPPVSSFFHLFIPGDGSGARPGSGRHLLQPPEGHVPPTFERNITPARHSCLRWNEDLSKIWQRFC